jgi:NTE family protein
VTPNNGQGSEGASLESDVYPRVGLALSGGVAKVVAHIGILQALSEASIPIHAIAATSGGAIIGAFYAAGKTPQEMQALAREISWKKLTRVTIPRLGLLSNERMETFVTERLGDPTFRDLAIPLAVVAADLTTGKKAVFTEGRIGPPIRASCSIPQVFTPVSINGNLVVDGGLVEYLPIQTLADMGCDIRIGVNLGAVHNWHAKDPKNFFEVALRVIGFVSQRNALISEQMADYVIRPDLSAFGPYELDRAEELIRIGYEAGTQAVPAILALIQEKAAERIDDHDWNRMVRWFRNHSPIQLFGKKEA